MCGGIDSEVTHFMKSAGKRNEVVFYKSSTISVRTHDGESTALCSTWDESIQFFDVLHFDVQDL